MNELKAAQEWMLYNAFDSSDRSKTVCAAFIAGAGWQAARSKPVVPDGEPEWPEYHAMAMGCGLEDRDITDRYEAMQYGFDDAVERCAEAFSNWIAAAPAQVQASPWVADTEAAIQLAFELGGLEDGSYHLEADELERVLRAALPPTPEVV